MDFVLKGRGVEITEALRRTVERKLAKLSRLVPRALRLEVEIISERNPRLDGSKRLEAALALPRHTFRVRAEGRDVEAALDQLVERLERRIRDHREKRRNRIQAGGDRLKSRRISPEGAGPLES